MNGCLVYGDIYQFMIGAHAVQLQAYVFLCVRLYSLFVLIISGIYIDNSILYLQNSNYRFCSYFAWK